MGIEADRGGFRGRICGGKRETERSVPSCIIECLDS